MATMREEFENKWRHIVEKEFIPANRLMQAVGPEERIASALEYIAAQLGQINARLGELVKLQANPARGN